jgi:glycosyltransferase involved in cell wall biosynthesis
MSTVISSYTAVVTSYNAEKTIYRCLESIAKQTLVPSEIIVVDDCSSDTTVSILSEFEFGGCPIILRVNPSNRGQSYGRNLASSLSNYETLIFFDDDDEALPGRAEEHIHMLQCGADLSYVSSIKIYSQDYCVKMINKAVGASSIPVGPTLNFIFSGVTMPQFGNFSVPCSTLGIRKEFFRKIAGFDESLRRLEDVDLFLKAVIVGGLVSWSNEVGVLRFHTEGEDKGGGIDSKFEEFLLSKYQDYFSKNDYNRMLWLMKLRSIYFNRKFYMVPFFLLKNPGAISVVMSKISALISRINHDLKIWWNQ